LHYLTESVAAVRADQPPKYARQPRLPFSTVARRAGSYTART
jgi:hypothetical protein